MGAAVCAKSTPTETDSGPAGQSLLFCAFTYKVIATFLRELVLIF